MIDLKIYAPARISTKKLREDLHAIVASNQGYFVSGEASLSLYGYSVQQSWQYKVLSRGFKPAGRVFVLTNDFNYFEEPAPYVAGGKISYSAKITFTGFDLSSSEFLRLKQALEHLNDTYLRRNSFSSSLDEFLQKIFN